MEKSILACSLVLLLGLAIFSTANGTEKKLKTVFLNQLSNFVTDTVPSSKNAEKMSRREERKVRKKVKEEVEKEQSRNEDLEQALNELSEEQERLNTKREEIIERRKEQIEKDVEARQKELGDLDLDREELKAVAQKHAIEAEKQMRLIEAQTLNKDLQATLADAQVQIQKTINLKNDQHLQLQQYLNDSVIVQLKNMRLNAFNGEVDQILAFLAEHKVAKAKDITSFSLDANALKVNGNIQPSSLHEELKKRYLGRKDDHINYLKSGDSVSITIQRHDDNDSDNDSDNSDESDEDKN